ncbi:MAG: OmpA family protein [Nitrospira sp.]|nr:OmpA family protein [Nitrospira sp.]
MIIKLSAVALVSIVIFSGTIPVSLAAEDSEGPSSQDELSVTRTHLQQAKQKIDELKQRIGELVLQLHAKENEVATQITNAHANSKQLREDLSARAEELNQAKRRIAELEQQLAASGKGQELAQAKRRVAEADQQLAKKEQELAQAKRRVTDIEQQLAAVVKEQELAQPKRRFTDVEQQLAGKEQELAHAKRRAAEADQQLAGKEYELAQAKRRVTEIEQQLAGREQELAHARRRAGEVEQQMAGKEQELAQARRRAGEIELQLAGKEQELAQAKRRAGEAEQQTAKKEQELAQAKEELKQVTQKLTDLNPQLLAKDAELTRAKQLLVESELNSSKPAAPTAAQEEGPPSLSLLPIDHTLSLSAPIGSDPESTDEGDAFSANGDLGKINESLANLLQPEIKKGSATLRQRGNRLTLALATSELFSTGDATVTLGGTSLIERVGVVLHGFRYQSIEVAGHTDNTPPRNDPRKGFRDNMELSRARAEHVTQVLINGGLEADRVKAAGYADSKPIAANETDKGRSKNRRMEIVIAQGTEPAGTVGDGKTQAGKKLQDSPIKR